MLLCSNHAIYTGWTTDINRRLSQHKSGRGANYTKMNSPVELIYWETQKTNQTARKRELALKKMTHQMKKNITNGEIFKGKNNNRFSIYEFFVSSPGRVNLLGEHVDYNGGPVLPAAIDRSVSLWANRKENLFFNIKSEDLNQEVSFSLDSLMGKKDINQQTLPDWALYPAAVIWAAHQKNHPISGFEAIFSSNVPIGAGLSSSAAIEVAFAALMREIGRWDMDDMELALMCQFAENEYVGVKCGIMDQFACANGVENSALYLDTSNLNWYPVTLPKDIAIIITDSKIRRTLSTSAYNERRNSCEEALKILKVNIPNIQFLSEVLPEQFFQYEQLLPTTTRKRAKHVIEECYRVRLAAEFLRNTDIHGFGQLMKEGHISLRELYEVSLPELDLLVELANNFEHCYGSRLTGAGFGGCTVSLVKEKKSLEFIEYMKKEYSKSTGIVSDIYICKARDGVRVEWRRIN
jgi:galactokinase